MRRSPVLFYSSIVVYNDSINIHLILLGITLDSILQNKVSTRRSGTSLSKSSKIYGERFTFSLIDKIELVIFLLKILQFITQSSCT